MVANNEKVVEKKRKLLGKKLIFVLIVIVTLVALSAYIANLLLHPRVILGGQTIHVDYTSEGFVYIEDFLESEYEYAITESVSPVQIGETPILGEGYFENAINRYKNEFIETKTINNGKIYRKYEDVFYFEERFEDLDYTTSSTGKISMFIPEISTALAFAHPISTNDVRGAVYSAAAIGIAEDGDGIDTKKTSKVIGYLLGNDVFDTTIKYNKEKVEPETIEYITIARKNEVELGKAYLYTDFGEGLNYYEIEIVSFTDPEINLEIREDFAFRGKVFDDTIFEEDRFYFEIRDERFLEKEMYSIIPGMSGSPVIQNGKLIGFSGYSSGNISTAVYAESAYWDTVKKYFKEDYK